MSNLEARLHRLEARAAAQKKESYENDPMQEMWQHIVASMDPDHLRIAMESVKPNRLEGFSPGYNLHLEMYSLLFKCVQNPAIPCVMPPEVAQIFLDDREAMFLHDCEDCGYPIPMPPTGQAGTTQTSGYRYFKSCPLCSGRHGYNAYSRNHQKVESGYAGLGR